MPTSLRLLPALLLAGSLLSPAGAAAQGPELSAARREIREMLVAGLGERALAALAPLLAANNGDSGLHALHGEALFELGRYGEAIDAFERAVSLDPALRGKLFNHGRALQEIGRHEEAIAVFEAMRAEPERARRAQGAFGLGLSRGALGDDEAAAALFREALALDPGSERARYRLALIDMSAGRFAEAESALSLVLAADPLHHGAAYNRALALGRLGRQEESDAAWNRYRQVLAGKQRISLLEARLTGGAEDLDLQLELGHIHAELDAHAAALGWFQRAGALAPADPRPALGAVASLRAIGRAGDAERLCAALLSREPPIEELRAPLIEMLEARGAGAEADRWRKPGGAPPAPPPAESPSPPQPPRS